MTTDLSSTIQNWIMDLLWDNVPMEEIREILDDEVSYAVARVQEDRGLRFEVALAALMRTYLEETGVDWQKDTYTSQEYAAMARNIRHMIDENVRDLKKVGANANAKAAINIVSIKPDPEEVANFISSSGDKIKEMWREVHFIKND